MLRLTFRENLETCRKSDVIGEKNMTGNKKLDFHFALFHIFVCLFLVSNQRKFNTGLIQNWKSGKCQEIGELQNFLEN